jgi:hypothetical protein
MASIALDSIGGLEWLKKCRTKSKLREIKRYTLLYISEVGDETFNKIVDECQYIEIHSVDTDYHFTRRMRTCIRYDDIIIISW